MKKRSFVLIVLCTLAIACGGGGGSSETERAPEQPSAPDTATPENPDTTPDDSGNPPTGPGAQSTLRVTTFNAGLLPFIVPMTDERVAVVSREIQNSTADVLCLQEVWRSSDANQILSAARANYPHQHFIPARQKFAENIPACDQEVLTPLLLCIATECSLRSTGFIDCVSEECQSELFELADENPECAAAVYAQTGKPLSDLPQIQDQLFGVSSPAGLFAFDGSSGTVLLSRLPFEDTGAVDFFDASTTSRRVALFARVQVGGRNHVIGCTHLAANLDTILPYTGVDGSWQGEARQQAVLLLDFADRFALGDPQLLAGDFNCSPSGNGRRADSEENCTRFENAGYQNLGADQLRCSYCSSNPLTQQNNVLAGSRDTLLDHIFTKNVRTQNARAALVFQQTDPALGVPPSDHFGVELTIHIE